MKHRTGIITSLLLIVALFGFTGCATRQTLAVAQGKPRRDFDETNERKLEPAAYAFLPISVVLYTVTLPFQEGLNLAASKGCFSPHHRIPRSTNSSPRTPAPDNSERQDPQP